MAELVVGGGAASRVTID